MELILQLAIIIIASKIAGRLSSKLGLPSVLGKLLIGIIVGPTVLGLIHETEMLDEFSEIGVILLMFIAGLETDIEEFQKSFKASTLIGLGGIIVPLVIGFLAGKILNLPTMGAIFLGLLLSATSVSISVQALKEMKQLKTKEGAAILGAAVIDDIVVMIAFAFLMSFIGSEVSLTMLVLQKVIFFAGAIITAWKVVPWFMRKFTSLRGRVDGASRLQPLLEPDLP
ncbi:sodium:proton antiporter, partial [Tissierella creatinini]